MNRTLPFATALLALVACGETTRLDECQGSSNVLECELCCQDFDLGEVGVRFSSTGTCTCVDPREEETETEDEAS